MATRVETGGGDQPVEAADSNAVPCEHCVISTQPPIGLRFHHYLDGENYARGAAAPATPLRCDGVGAQEHMSAPAHGTALCAVPGE